MLIDGDEDIFQMYKITKMLNYNQKNETSYCFDNDTFPKQNNPDLLSKLTKLNNSELERYINSEQRGMANKFLY